MTAVTCANTSLTYHLTASSNGTYHVKWPTSGTALTAASWDTNDDTCYITATPEGQFLNVRDGALVVPRNCRLVLPDGTVIHVDADGNFQLDDAAAQVIYKANRMREFNPFVNASDLLARFIAYVRALNIPSAEVMKLPVALFVNWLVIEAARADGDPVPGDVTPPERHKLLTDGRRPRCLFARCQRFVPRRLAGNGFRFCNPAHAASHYALIGGQRCAI